MAYMALPVSFRWDPEFVRAVDDARGDVPRSVFVRRAVERALESRRDSGLAQAPKSPAPASEIDTDAPAPAEQPVNRAEMFRRATQR